MHTLYSVSCVSLHLSEHMHTLFLMLSNGGRLGKEEEKQERATEDPLLD